jgi:hypothetical protein
MNPHYDIRQEAATRIYKPGAHPSPGVFVSMKRNVAKHKRLPTGKRNIHLVVDASALIAAKVRCAREELALSAATAALWSMWGDGHIDIDPKYLPKDVRPPRP